MPRCFQPINEDFLTQVHREPDVYLVKAPCPQAVSGFTNCYIVQDQEERLFIDAGQENPASLDVWTQALESLKRPSRGKQALFLTHLHGDHSGLVSQLAGHHMPIYIPRANYIDSQQKQDPRYFETLLSRRESEGVSATDIRELKVYGASYYIPVPENLNIHLVHEGQSISVGRYAFRVLDTSGHTMGHASLYCPKSGILFGGDHVLFMVTPVLEAHIGRIDMMSRYLDSLAKVARLETTALFHSHGPLRDDFRERIQQLDLRQRRRIEEAYELLRATPRMTGNELVRAIRWNQRGREWEDLHAATRLCILESGLTILDHLCATDRVEREMLDGFWRYTAAE